MSAGTPCLGEVLTHLQAFARDRKTPPEHVHVRLTLADGAAVILQGLRVAGTGTAGAWAMIQSAGGESSEALVVREAHVLKAEFQTAPVGHAPIGFHSEATR